MKRPRIEGTRYPRHWSVVLVLTTIACLGVSTDGKAQSISLSTDSTTIVLEAGAVGTRMVQVENTGDETATGRFALDLPAGWSVLIPPSSMSIPGSGRSRQILSFQVPGSTTAGTYFVGVAWAGTTEQLRIPVEVSPRLAVQAEWVEEAAFARAGSALRYTLRLVNRGNAPGEWVINARSSLGYGIDLSDERIQLEEGGHAQVDVRVSTGGDISGQLTHALNIDIEPVSASETGADAVRAAQASTRLTTTSTILPSRTRTARQEGRIPVILSLGATQEGDRQAGQVQVEIPETPVEDRLVSMLLRGPDIRRTSSFALPDRYALQVSDPEWEVKLGDHAWEVSDLLDLGSFGFGAGGEKAAGRWVAGAHVQRSRRIFPSREHASGFVEFQPSNTVSIRTTGLARRSFEEGDALSLAAAWAPGAQSFRAEWAGGQFGDESGQALMGDMILARGRSSFSFRAETADGGFLGSIRNTSGLRGAFVLSLAPWARIQGQARGRQRTYDFQDRASATQTIGQARLGVTLTRTADISRTTVTITGIGQLNENTLSQLTRDEQSVQARISWNRRRAGFSFTGSTGSTSDPLVEGDSGFRRADGAIFGTRGAYSFNLSGGWLSGPTFYNPIDQQRIQAGLNLGWSPSTDTQVSVGLYHHDDLDRDNQSFSLLDARASHRFGFGHEVSLRARSVRTGFAADLRNTTVSATYSIPLSIRAPGQPRTGRVIQGQIVDVETGQPAADVLVSMDEVQVASGPDGRFELRLPAGASGYVNVDRASLGFDRRPIGTWPRLIRPEDMLDETLQIDVVRSAQLEVQVVLSEQTTGRTSARAVDMNDRMIAGLVVEIRSGSERVRRLTDRSGRVRISDLVPGATTVHIVGNSLPDGMQARPDTVRVDLVPGASAAVDLSIRPVVREIKLVTPGGASGGGIKIQGVRSVGVQAVRVQESSQESSDEPADNSDTVPNDADPDDSNASTQQEAPAADQPDGAPSRTQHIVDPGDTLASLARRYLGSTLHWIRIWQSNQELIPNPDFLVPGISLNIPDAGPLTPAERASLLDWANRE